MASTSDLPKAKFPLGQIIGTPRALRVLDTARQAPWEYIIKRHAQGDWGDMCNEDHEANERALLEGDRLMSAYTLPTGVKVWVITEADRSATTIMLPEEY